MLHFLRRLFLGWRAPVRLGRRTIAVPIILSALLLCCGSVFVWALVDTSLRQAGVLPTYTPTATRPPTDAPSPTLPPTATPVPPTVTLAPTATATPAPVEPSPAPLPTSTPVPTAAPPVGPAASEPANLRAGPGTAFGRVGSVAEGEALEIIGRTPSGDWYELPGGRWIAAFLVLGAPATVPVSSAIPVPPTVAPAVASATPRGLPAAAASDCDCTANTLNCDDFIAWDAQACYLRCQELAGRDVHGLDRDNDGRACEWEY